MKLKQEDVVEITKENLKDLLKALQFSHADAGRICDLSPFAISRWRSSSHVPKAHLIRLAAEFAKQVDGKSNGELTPAQIRTKTFIETKLKTPLAVLAATGSAAPSTLLGGSAVSNMGSNEKRLSDASIQELAQELESRGWRVSLSLKKK